MQYILLQTKNCLKSCKDVRICNKQLNKCFKTNLIICNHFFTYKNQNSLKMSKKGYFENPKVINHDFSTKLVPE